MASPAPQSSLFSLLPESRKPWTKFAFSIASQALAVTLFLWVGVLHPEILRPSEHTYRSIALVPTPVPVNHVPQSLRAHEPVLVARLTAPEALHLLASQPKLRTEVPEAAPEVQIADKKLDSLPEAAPVIPKQMVKTNLFSSGSSAPQTIAKAADKVQTGGFGDPNGIPAKGNEGKVVNVAQLGSFDLPTGGGKGNGTGGANGVRGVVASSGFGNGVSTSDTNDRTTASRTSVRQAGFGDVNAAQSAAHSPITEAAAKVVPAEILSKPNPAYTQEARSLRIEGEVLLQVVFQATGQLQVVRVVRGLGHGLDDSAVRAAEQIHFKPALRDGRPSDSTAVLHIVFQLA